MKKQSPSPISSILTAWFCCVCSVCLSFISPSAWAIGSPDENYTVVYNPNTLQSITAELPVSWSYALDITAPTLTGATTVTLSAHVESAPVGVSVATAASYVTFSQPVLNFAATGQTLRVVITFTAPAGAPTGDYNYHIIGSGWPLGSIDEGTFINMHAIPPAALLTPTVTIDTPADGSTYTYVVGGPAIPVSISISGKAPENAPVLTLTATISAEDADGLPILPETPLVLLLTGLGTPNALGTVTLPISTPGIYTISADDTNSEGAASDINKFIVKSVVPPPTVVINPPINNPTYTYVRGLTSVTVPYTFVGTSLLGGIQSLTATLDGNPITTATLSGLGQLVATGTGSLTFNASTVNALGQHTIQVTATDPQGTTSASATFVVAELTPQISIDIANPLDGAVIPLPPDASLLNVPYSFVSSVTQGGTVKALTATLTSDAGISSVTIGSVVGLNTATATGSGTFLNVTPGVYTLGATGANSDLSLSAFDSATFTVTPPPPPTIVFTQAPQPTYTALRGYPLSVPFTIKTSSTGAYISTQSVTLDGTPVSGLTSTADGTALTATGGATLTIPAPSTGTTTYTLVATGTDVYGQFVSTTTTFDVTVNDPVITIAINPQIVANSPYTMPTSGSLSIPFVFTGSITTGATVDTITGNLGGTTNVTISSSTGLGSAATATASGNLSISAPGTYTVTATDTNIKSGTSATTSVTFVVKAAQPLPPLSVSITQAPAATYTLLNGCTPLSIPIAFVGKSNNGYSGGNVSTMTATLDGKPVTLATLTGIGTPTASATATLCVKTAGTHVLVVKDTDPFGQTATASATFVVTLLNPVISIVINAPTNNSVYYLPSGTSGGSCGGSTGASLSIPFTFTSTITTGATVDAISATLNGASLSVSKSGLGSVTATGTGNLTVSQAGTYKLSAKGINTGAGISATTSITFTVVKAAPPIVKVTQPTQTSFTSWGCSTLSIPYAFTATSQAGGISSLSAQLDGCSVSVTSSGIGTMNATGSGTLGVSKAGTHVLTVTAKDPNGTTSTKFTFTVVSQNASPVVTISAPTDGAVYTYAAGATPPSIPYKIVAKTNGGATISSLKATLNGCNVSISNSGIGSDTVTGTGTLAITCAGTYTLSGTTVSGGISATSKITFSVKQTAAPTCSVNWQGSVCSGTSLKGGHSVPVKCTVTSTSGSSSCTVKDTSVKFSVCEVYSNGSTSAAKIYSSDSYTIDSNNVYCLNLRTSSGAHRYRVDTYCYPNGGNTPKLIGSKEFKTY